MRDYVNEINANIFIQNIKSKTRLKIFVFFHFFLCSVWGNYFVHNNLLSEALTQQPHTFTGELPLNLAVFFVHENHILSQGNYR